MTIESFTDEKINCIANNELCELNFTYNPLQKEFKFFTENHLAELIHNYHIQFDKIIQSAIKGKIQMGQIIRCVFIDDFTFLKEEDYNDFILLDRRDNELSISTSKVELKDICKIYTDGSFAQETKNSGYGGFIENTVGEREIFSKSFTQEGASNLMELLAVADGLNRLCDKDKIQINTDSRFVIRGMTQWIHFWKHNDWQTAFGQSVVYADTWKEIDRLSDGKLIEIKWIKGHSGHTEHDFCHNLAQKSARIKD